MPRGMCSQKSLRHRRWEEHRVLVDIRRKAVKRVEVRDALVEGAQHAVPIFIALEHVARVDAAHRGKTAPIGSREVDKIVVGGHVDEVLEHELVFAVDRAPLSESIAMCSDTSANISRRV